jgi:hypothetical protein
MKHASVRELFEHWNERRGGRVMPQRADIDPAAIRRILADTFIVSCDASTGHPFRLAGTRVCALLGRELKGESFLHLFSTQARLTLLELLTIVTVEAIGVAATASELTAGERDRCLEMLLLPLADEGGGTARVLGALVPSDSLAWLGRRALGPLILGSYRFLHCEVAVRALPPAEKQARPNLVVYEGGLKAGQ